MLWCIVNDGHELTFTAKKAVMTENATKRNSTIKILIMFSIDLSIMLLI